MSFTEQQWAQMKRQVGYLNDHLRPLFNSSRKFLYEYLNDLEERQYTDRVLVVRRGYDVTMTRFGVNASLRDEIAQENVYRMNRAFRQDKPIQIPDGLLEVKGTIRAEDRKVNLQGNGNGSIIRQYNPVDTLVMDCRNGRLDQPIIRDLCFDVDSGDAPFTTGSVIKYMGYPTQDVPDRIFQMPGPVIENITIKGKDQFLRPIRDYLDPDYFQPWKTGFHIAMELENCNVSHLYGITIQGAGWRNPDGSPAGSIGLKMTATRASVDSTIVGLKIVDVTYGIVEECASYPGIEGKVYIAPTIAGVLDGYTAKNTAYGAPHRGFHGGHMAVNGKAFDVYGVQQIQISDMVLYNHGNQLPYARNTDPNPAYGKFVNTHNIKIKIQCHSTAAPLGSRPSDLRLPYGLIFRGEPGIQLVGASIDAEINLPPDCTNPGVWFQGYNTLNNDALHIRYFGSGRTVLSDSPSNRVHLAIPADPEDLQTVAVFDYEQETVLEFERDEAGNVVEGGDSYYVNRYKLHNGAQLWAQFNGSGAWDGTFILNLYDCRSDYVILPDPAALAWWPGTTGLDIPAPYDAAALQNYVIKAVIIGRKAKYTLKASVPVLLKQDTGTDIPSGAELELPYGVDLQLSANDTVTILSDSEKIQVAALKLEPVTVTDYTKCQTGRVNIIHQELITGLGDAGQYWEARQSEFVLLGVRYKHIVAANPFLKGLTIENKQAGDGWTGWRIMEPHLKESGSDPTTADVNPGQIIFHRHTGTGKKFIWWNDGGTVQKLNLSADYVGYSTGLNSDHGPMVYNQTQEGLRRTGWNDFYYSLKDNSGMITDLKAELKAYFDDIYVPQP